MRYLLQSKYRTPSFARVRLGLAVRGLFLAAALAPQSGIAVTCQSGFTATNPDSIYQDHGDGTVTDSRTGLTWKVCAEGQIWSAGSCSGYNAIATWGAALLLAEDSTFAGYTDWRLPNLKELRSLVEECRVSPSINEAVFPSTGLGTGSYSLFWASSPAALDPQGAWIVHFHVTGGSSWAERSSGYSVRLVRNGKDAASCTTGSCDTSPTLSPPHSVVTDVEVTPPRDKLVVVTHGWNSSAAAWPDELVNAICAKLPGMAPNSLTPDPSKNRITRYCQNNEWGVYAFDWAVDAATDLPFAALSHAMTSGAALAKDLWRRTNDGTQSWNSIHLIGHSAGSGFVEAFAREIKQLSIAADHLVPKIHATFLDAFCPNADGCSWGAAADLAEHYVDTRNVLPALGPGTDIFNQATLALTNVTLANAFNFDITPLDTLSAVEYTAFGELYPAEFHAFPYKYYIETAGGTPPLPFGSYAGRSVSFGGDWAVWTTHDWISTTNAYSRFSEGEQCTVSQTSDLGLDYCQSTAKRWWHQATRLASKILQSQECSVTQANPSLIVMGTCPSPSSLVAADMVRTETPAPAMALLKVSLAQPANRIRFDYQFTQMGAGGSLQVFAQDDKLIFATVQEASDTIIHHSGWIDTPAFTAGDQNLRLVVKPLGTDNAGAEISNIEFEYSSTVGSTPSFVDAPSNWATLYINGIFAAGITTGCGSGNYCPSQNVTREQMAAFVVRAKEGEPSTTCASAPFNDVPTSNSFCKYVQRMSALGITTGCGNGNYCPSQNVDRQQMAAFIIRAVEGNPVAGYCGAVSPFSDVQTTNGFCGHIKRMKELNITTGCGGTNYCPTQTVTREQMAAFLARAFLGM